MLVAQIVEQVRRMRPPCARHPHAFHEDKGDVIGALRELAEMVRSNP